MSRRVELMVSDAFIFMVPEGAKLNGPQMAQAEGIELLADKFDHIKGTASTRPNTVLVQPNVEPVNATWSELRHSGRRGNRRGADYELD